MSQSEAAMAARGRIARLLGEIQQAQLRLVQETRSLKALTAEGSPRAELDIVTEALEVYMSQNAAVLENLRGRMETRLGVIRRLEPVVNGTPESSPGHGPFWLSYSRLCAALRRAGEIAGR